VDIGGSGGKEEARGERKIKKRGSEKILRMLTESWLKMGGGLVATGFSFFDHFEDRLLFDSIGTAATEKTSCANVEQNPGQSTPGAGFQGYNFR